MRTAGGAGKGSEAWGPGLDMLKFVASREVGMKCLIFTVENTCQQTIPHRAEEVKQELKPQVNN